MSKHAETEEKAPSLGNQAICVHCRRLLPLGAFMRDCTGSLTAWCNACREDVAKKWGIDLDQVELVRALYVFEQGLKK